MPETPAAAIRQAALIAADNLGWLFAQWHNKFSTSELAAIETVRQALLREAEREP